MSLNWKVLAVGALVVVPLVAVLASGFGHDPRGRSNELEGTPAPDFRLVDLDGRTWDTAELRGRPMVLNYWATWCVPCLQEHEQLQRAARVYGPRGVVFLGMLYGDEPDAARRFLAERGAAYPTLIDPGDRTAIDYGVVGVPETFVIDRNGTIVRKFTGPVTFGVLAEVLEPLL